MANAPATILNGLWEESPADSPRRQAWQQLGKNYPPEIKLRRIGSGDGSRVNERFRQTTGVRPRPLRTPWRSAPGGARAPTGRLADHARSQGITQGFVIANARNAPAVQLYEAAGGQRTASDDVVFAFSWLTT